MTTAKANVASNMSSTEKIMVQGKDHLNMCNQMNPPTGLQLAGLFLAFLGDFS